MKRAQIPQQIFIFLLTLFLVAILLFFGYSLVRDGGEAVDKTQLLQLQQRMATDVGRLTQDFGTTKKITYSLPPGLTICFVDLSRSSTIVTSNEITAYPLVLDSLQSDVGHNVFILDVSLLESFNAGPIEIVTGPHFGCILSKNDGVTLEMEGRGNTVRIFGSFEQNAPDILDDKKEEGALTTADGSDLTEDEDRPEETGTTEDIIKDIVETPDDVLEIPDSLEDDLDLSDLDSLEALLDELETI